MRFTKMHGAGNDFVVLDLRPDRPAPSADLCRALADRRLGVGCDQILTIEPPRSPGAVAAYGIWNADGSRAGQCGNGARCVAAWLRRDAARNGLPLAARFDIDSPGGRHAVECLNDGGTRLDMGRPAFQPTAIPLAGSPEALRYTVELDSGAVRFMALSMGNPHAVIIVPEVATAPVERIGRALQAHAAFPDSVNVGFAEVVDHDHIRLRVYERGVGETLACGSGACAAAVALMREGLVGRSVDVELPGGTLRIDWPGDGATVAMAGPAAFVFEGEWFDD